MTDQATPVEHNMAFGPPPPGPATRDYIREIENMLDETGGDPEKVADWVNREVERRGAETAGPAFDMKGAGPSCSWCGALWPLCGHQHMSEVLDEPSKVNGWWSR